MNDTGRSPRTVHLVTALLLVGVYALGVVTGAALLRWLGPGRPPRHHGPPGMPPHFAELSLTEEQAARVKEILERHRPELDAILAEAMPRAKTVYDAMDTETRALLTPDQQQRFDALKARRPTPRGFGPGGPPPFGPGGPPPFGPGGPQPFGTGLGAPPPPPDGPAAPPSPGAPPGPPAGP
jgi:Spy/CpxP family protein refolding chaperone